MCSFLFFAGPTDPPSREGERWETKHFIGMALLQLQIWLLQLHISWYFLFPSVPIDPLDKAEFGRWRPCSCQILGGWRGNLNQRIKRIEISLSREEFKGSRRPTEGSRKLIKTQFLPGDDDIPKEPLHKLSLGPILYEDVKRFLFYCVSKWNSKVK